MSDPSEFKKGFDRTMGGCSALMYVAFLLLSLGFLSCAGCFLWDSRSSKLPPLPASTMKGSFR